VSLAEAARTLGILAGSALLGLLVHALLFGAIRTVGGGDDGRHHDGRDEGGADGRGRGEGPSAPGIGSVLEDSFLRHCESPARWTLVLVALRLALPTALGSGRAVDALTHGLGLLLISAVAWFFVRLTRVLEEFLRERFDAEVADNLQARKVHTQVEVLRKILVVGIVLVAFAAALTSFDRLRQLGAGLLASAGIAGLVLGLAAQRTLGNLLAGFQIAITQPIRLDDVVVVEGEWGRIEEITLTYVVVAIWDRRRLVLPIGWFLENPFQNWTRETSQILGTVFLHVDHRVPVEEVREALREILEESPHWNGEVWRLHVTEAGERSVQLRALMSADDAGTAWELRCEVRERLLAWLRERHPGGLPRVRAELEGPRPPDPRGPRDSAPGSDGPPGPGGSGPTGEERDPE